MRVEARGYPKVEVCGPCGTVAGAVQLRNSGGWVQQGGSCPTHRLEEGPKWPGYDFNLELELCRSCGQQLIQSGSRFSFWFCAACRADAERINTAFERCVIPVGRHSVHTGWLLWGERVQDPAIQRRFLLAMEEAARTGDVIDRWAREAVRLNLEALGRSRDDRMLLVDYDAARQVVDRRKRFRWMCEYLDQEKRLLASGHWPDPGSGYATRVKGQGRGGGS